MPEAKWGLVYGYTPEPPKKPPIIKVSCGIGDTDGFPAFDVDSEAYAAKEDPKWGFLITGGAEFHMPLTVFQVTPGGLADKGGIRLGDIILEINEEDATQLTLAQAHERINASGKKIHFQVKSMDEDEDQVGGAEQGEEKCIVLRVPKPLPPPKAASIEARLREMQRKLSEIAEIPRILSSTLATVAQTFDKLVPAGEEQHQEQQEQPEQQEQQQRKYSYDEDAYDYELTDSDDGDNGGDGGDSDDSEIEEEDGLAARAAYLELKRRVAEQSGQRDLTPESDYASEANFGPNEALAADGGHDDEDGVSGDGGEAGEDDDENEDENEDVGDATTVCDYGEQLGTAEQDENDEGFLSTTFTWTLRNARPLDPSERKASNNSDSASDEEDPTAESELPRESLPSAETQTRKREKLDMLERCWPWADREKIIYKQSTCHLVPRKPLGLVEQRKQLLVKRNLLERLAKAS